MHPHSEVLTVQIHSHFEVPNTTVRAIIQCLPLDIFVSSYEKITTPFSHYQVECVFIEDFGYLRVGPCHIRLHLQNV